MCVCMCVYGCVFVCVGVCVWVGMLGGRDDCQPPGSHSGA